MFRRLSLISVALIPVAALGALFGSATASAHVTLETKEARIGSSYKAVLKVPHGCDGAATVTLAVQIPDGVIEVKPMPKPGWTLRKEMGKYPKPHRRGGATLTEGVTQLTWSGGKLPDDYYDEFVFVAAVADDLEPATIYFPVVQQCEKGAHHWIEVPPPGQSNPELSEPAPALKLLPQR
jgi:uncharacterized protein YcnI